MCFCELTESLQAMDVLFFRNREKGGGRESGSSVVAGHAQIYTFPVGFKQCAASICTFEEI